MPIPLQIPGMPGGPEILVLYLLFVVLAFFVGRWVYRDAKSRGSNWAWQWGSGTAIMLVTIGPGLLVLAVYLLVRGDKPDDREQTDTSIQNRREEFILTFGALLILALFVAGVVSPPDPLTQLYYMVPLGILCPIVAYLLVYRNGYRYVRRT